MRSSEAEVVRAASSGLQALICNYCAAVNRLPQCLRPTCIVETTSAPHHERAVQQLPLCHTWKQLLSPCSEDAGCTQDLLKACSNKHSWRNTACPPNARVLKDPPRCFETATFEHARHPIHCSIDQIGALKLQTNCRQAEKRVP